MSEPGSVVTSYEEVVSGLLEASHRVHPERVASLLAEHLPRLGMDDVAVYLADLDQRSLVPLDGEGLPDREVLSIDGTLAGRAFRTETPLNGADTGTSTPGATRLWVPLVDGSERLGVLAVTVAEPDELTRRRARSAASIAAAMIVGKLPYGDKLAMVRRRHDMDVAAELRWDSLPPLTYVNDRVAISGLLEPAYEIAGDTFDYALNGDLAHVAILDAVGHGLEASRMANLAIGSYRNGRRRGAKLEELYSSMDEIVARVFGPEKFVTGQLGALDMVTGRLQWINAGHPHPILLRGTSTIDVPTVACLPLGMGDEPVFCADIAFEPGDVILFFTDGVIEARAEDGELFGRERLAELLVRTTATGDPIAETARKLCHAVLAHQHGRLQDDATLLLLSWKGGFGLHV